MSITAMTPDGVSHQFPDGTSGDVITSAMQDYVSKNPQGASPTPGATDAANDSYMNDMKAGVGGAMQDLGGLAQGVGLTSAGNWLRQNAPQPDAAYTGRGGQFLPDLKAGQFSRAAGDLGHGLASGSAESALEAGGAIGGGALGTLVGPEGTAAGAIGGGVGAGLMAGGLGLGRHARLAAGQRAVTGSDLANAAPAAAGDAVIGGLTMGRVPGGTLGRMAAQGAGGAAQSTLDQYADTGTVDPNQVANSAASGAAFGGVTGAGSDVKAGIGRVANDIQSRGEAYQPVNEQQAATFARTRNALQEAAKEPDAPSDLNKVANNLKSSWTNDVQDRIAQMKAQGASADAIREASSLLERAQRHNNVLYISDLDGLDHLDHVLSEEHLQDLKDRLLDLNTLSINSFKNRNVGPLQAIGSKIGGLATTAGLFAAGDHATAAMNLIAGSALENKIGAKIGSAGDRLLGLQKVPLMLQGQAADRMLSSQPAPVNPLQVDPNFVPPSVAMARLKAAQAAQATQTSKANTLRQAMVAQGQQNLPQSGLTTPAPALMKVPYEPPAQPSLTTPAPALMKVPYQEPAKPGLTTPAPDALRQRVQAQAQQQQLQPEQAALPAGPMDTHGRLINDPAAHHAAIQAYRSNAMLAAMQADGEAPGAGLGQIITDIMDTHHHGFADASLPADAKAAARADTRSKTIAMKQGKAQAAMALVAPEHQHILAKYLTPALLRHG